MKKTRYSILDNIKYINLFSETLPFIFLIIFHKRIVNKDKRFFFIYALITTILVLLAVLFLLILDESPKYFLTARVHTVIEFFLLSYILCLNIKNKTVKKFAPFLTVPFFIFCLIDFINAKTPSIAYIPLLTECSFFIILIIFFFFEKVKQEVAEPLFATFIFWFVVAFLINFSGNFLLFFYSETSKKEPNFRINYLTIYSTVTIFKNILLCIAVSIKEKPIEVIPDPFRDIDYLPLYPEKTESI